ncbi:MAG: PEGA domain-containing protein [Prevotella sp.]|nr:PEGA domain-containing protein [Prevotella sp.]MBQ9561499.1 PEGA domain-containing protein [Prevotella sp.]
MKTLKIFISFLLMSVVQIQYTFAQEAEQMQFQNDLRQVSNGELGNLTEMMTKDRDWYLDENGAPAAVLRIKVVDMPVAEIKKLTFSGSACVKRETDEEAHVIYVTVGAGTNGTYLEASHEVFQQSSRLRLNDIKPKKLYDVTLVNNKTTSIVLTVKASETSGIECYIDDQLKGSSQLKNGETSLTVNNMRYGKHSLRISSNGRLLKKEDINVEEGQTHFPFDLRESQTVTITSDPDGAAVYVDGTLIGKAPQTLSLVLGVHNFRAELSASQQDEENININKGSNTISLHPVKKGNVTITTKYAGRPVDANLVVDNEKNFNSNETYNLVLPYGNHLFRVNYGGKEKEKTINVNKPEMSHVFKLSAKNDFVWPWQREYDDRPAGFSIGYVSKQIVSKNGSQRVKVDPAYFRESKWLSGIQIGLHFQPTFSWGGGLYTGLFYELYFAKSDTFAGESIDDAYNNFTEHSLNIPLNLYYRMPFSKKFSIAIRGGVSMDVGLYAFYAGSFMGASDDSNSEVMSDYYGEDNIGPRRINFTADLGVSFNIGPVGINGFYSKGLTNHSGIVDWEDGGGKTHINKFGLSISWLIGDK